MLTLVKNVLRKIIIRLLFNRHVINNTLVQEDIRQTLLVRGSKAIKKDLHKQFVHVMLYYPEFAFVFFWRIKKRPFYYNWFVTDFQCKIFRSTQIGGGLMCYHPVASVINAKSIGANFQFRNGLTIGNKHNNNNMLPIIGNDVTVGANVVIIGDIRVGDNVVIGAGSVVVKDIPNNVVIAGNPARIIKAIDG